jgi:ribosomal protein L19
VVGVEVVRSGKTRRAKLFWLRKRVGKATRLREVDRTSKSAETAAPEA